MATQGVMLGNGHSDVGSHVVHPSWFKPESFLQPDFDPQAYVAGVRKYVPLDQVSHELDRYLASLKSRLVEVINEDYNDFVSLSTKLVNIDGSVLRMQKPLLELKDRLGAVQAAIRGQLDALNEGLARRQQVAACRATLELMQDTAHVMSKVEKLITEANDAGDVSAMSEDDLAAHARLLERVGGEMARLQFFSARGADLALMQQLAPRIARAATSAEARFSEALQTALSRGQHSTTAHCLHAFASINATAVGEAVIRRVVVRPVVTEVVASAASGPTAAPAPDVLPTLLATLSPQGGLQGFNLLGAAILAEVDTQLAAHLSGAFSPGVPDTFHTNYLAAVAFLAALESQCQTQASVAAFRECAAYTTFTKRWNLSVYYSLRFQEVAGSLEGVLSAADALDTVPSEETQAAAHLVPLRCVPTHATLRALERACAREVVLRPLADKFVRLSLQCIMRCVAWASAGLQARAHAADEPLGSPQGSGVSPGVGGPAADGAVPSQAMGPVSWGPQCSQELLTLLAADLVGLQGAVEGPVARSMLAAVDPLPPDVAASVQDAYNHGASALGAVAAEARESVAATLAERCVAALKQLRGIVATFRMSNKAEPTRPSHYVAAMFLPLKAYSESEQVAALLPEHRTAIIQAVADTLTARYIAVVNDTLTTVRKTEMSLKRLKGRRGGGEAEGEGSTTDQMLCRQLLLDVQEYGRQLVRLGAQVEGCPAFAELWGIVAPEGQAVSLS